MKALKMALLSAALAIGGLWTSSASAQVVDVQIGSPATVETVRWRRPYYGGYYGNYYRGYYTPRYYSYPYQAYPYRSYYRSYYRPNWSGYYYSAPGYYYYW